MPYFDPSVPHILIVYLQCVLLGVVQGLTEFWPVSSSAHLWLVEHWMQVDYGQTFAVAVHGGSLLAVTLALREDIGRGIQGTWNYLRSGGEHLPAEPAARLGTLALVAAVPTAIIGFAVEHILEHSMQSPWVMAWSLVIFSIIMLLVDAFSNMNREITQLGVKQALWLGLMQALAFVPGVSRSGMTITVARGLGLRLSDAVRLSFLCSVPVVGGAFFVKLARGFELPDAAMYGPYLAGIIAAAGAAYASIKALSWLSSRSSLFWPALYRVVLAAAIVWWAV